MMLKIALPTASRNDAPPMRSRIVLLVVLLSLLSSVVTIVQEWGSSTEERVLLSTAPFLRGLLFQRGSTLDLYDFSAQERLVRSANAFEHAEEHSVSARLLSPRAVLVGAGKKARVRDMGSSYTYIPLSETENSSLVHLSRTTNFTYSLPDDSGPAHLRITFAACGEIADIPLAREEAWYEAGRLFRTLNLPMQRAMLLSPAETSLALVTHDSYPRITLVDVIARHAAALSVPSFDPDQLHFSPFFIDNRTLLFSVLDRRHWSTAIYHISDGTYEILSPDFTDRAYHSVNGKVILRQSFYDDINIPFGSIALLDQKRGIPSEIVESLAGPKEIHPAVLSLLFQNPTEPLLHFRTDLTSQSFNAIAESDLREPLRAFWRDYQLKMMRSVGVFRLLEWEPDGALTQREIIPFEIRPPASFVQYVEDTEPLLRALKLPSILLEEYRKRSTEAKEKGEDYVLVDELSY